MTFQGHAVVVISSQGDFLRHIPTEAVSKFPNGIDISDSGDIVVGDSHGNKFHVAVYDRHGVVSDSFLNMSHGNMEW